MSEARKANIETTAGCLLVVQHGRTRGPRIRFRVLRPGAYEPIFDDLERRYPALWRRLRFWETGNAMPDLDGVCAVLFLLQDPLRELFPDCYWEATQVAEAAKSRGIRLVNPPRALSNSIKSLQARLWERAGLTTPPHTVFSDYEELVDAVSRCSFPAILRADWLHSQATMLWCEDRAAVLKLPKARIAYPGSLTPVVDTRQGFREVAPGTAWAEFFHKKRALVFGNRVRTNHLFFGRHPIVGSKTCTFSHYRSLNPIRRLSGRWRCRQHVALDLAFFESEQEHTEVLLRAASALDLEFVAIDYSSKADGTVVLWEANPHFALHMWPFQILSRQRRVAERYRVYHDLIHDFFVDLLEGEA